MKHLTRGQRYDIQMYSLLGMNKSEIAHILHVHKSTITREFQRNSDVRNKGTYYLASRADRKQKKRYAARRGPRKFTDEMKEKARYFLEELQMSPEQIVGYCKKHGIEMVSHETLYQWIWADKKAGAPFIPIFDIVEDVTIREAFQGKEEVLYPTGWTYRKGLKSLIDVRVSVILR